MKKSTSIIVFLYSLVLTIGVTFAAKVITFPVSRTPLPTGNSERDLSPRSSTLEVLTNNKTIGGYYASIELGTPAQTVSLQLVTGTSEVWVIDNSVSSCVNYDAESFCSTRCKLSLILSKGSATMV